MKRDAAMTERLRGVIARLESQTRNGDLCWKKQAGSAHRYTQIQDFKVNLKSELMLEELVRKQRERDVQIDELNQALAALKQGNPNH